MTDPLTFALAVVALLATPGPTNTLLAASGATLGWRRSLALIPAELAGYLVAILSIKTLLALIANPATALFWLKVAACLWLTACAIKLWRQAGTGGASEMSPLGPGRLFTTTLINPKAMVFATMVIPGQTPDQWAPWLGAFAGMAIVIALGWIGMGAGLNRAIERDPARSLLVWRATAMVLALFATMVGGSAVTAW